MQNQINTFLGYLEFLRYLSARDSLLNKIFNYPNLRFTQFCASASFTLSRYTALFIETVSDIILHRSNPKMTRIKTGWIIAAMKDFQGAVNVETQKQCSANSISSLHFSIPLYVAISIPCFSSSKIPAIRNRVDRAFSKQSVYNWFRLWHVNLINRFNHNINLT